MRFSPFGIVDELVFFFFQAEDGIRDLTVTGVQTCALPICAERAAWLASRYNMVVLGAVGLLFISFAGPIVGLFTHDPVALPTGALGLRTMRDRKSRRVGKECRSRWSPYH